MWKFYHKMGNTTWNEISELELHAKLYVHVKLTTPVIKRLLRGEEVTINGDDFKISYESNT